MVPHLCTLLAAFSLLCLLQANAQDALYCPAPRMRPEVCGLLGRPYCLGDAACAPAGKCCFDGCGPACTQPTKEKPGECPSVRCRGSTTIACLTSEGCGADLVCCPDAAGSLVCTVPEMNTPGVVGCCPPVKFSSLKECPHKERFEQCRRDEECESGLKCCWNGCGGRCVARVVCGQVQVDLTCCPAPKFASPGQCPAEEQFDECVTNTSCKGDANLKCCFNGCGNRCLVPVPCKPINQNDPCPVKPGSCPAPWFTLEECTRVLIFPCEGDLSCQGDQKCCWNGCGGFSCAQPKAKPGFCPAPVDQDCVCPRIDFWCSNDDCCPDNLKCCDNGCGTSCVKPLTEKPGTCPITLAAVTRQLEGECRTDADCPGTLKCCVSFAGVPICSQAVFTLL